MGARTVIPAILSYGTNVCLSALTRGDDLIFVVAFTDIADTP